MHLNKNFNMIDIQSKAQQARDNVYRDSFSQYFDSLSRYINQQNISFEEQLESLSKQLMGMSIQISHLKTSLFGKPKDEISKYDFDSDQDIEVTVVESFDDVESTTEINKPDEIAEQSKSHIKDKRTNKDISDDDIQRMYFQQGMTVRAIAEHFNVNPQGGLYKRIQAMKKQKAENAKERASSSIG